MPEVDVHGIVTQTLLGSIPISTDVPPLTESMDFVSGIPAETSMIRMVLGLGDGDILIPTIDEMKLEGVDVLADAQKLFDRINVGLPKDKQLVLR